jgi:acyl carrier protein
MTMTNERDPSEFERRIREVIVRQGSVAGAATLGLDRDLYEAGMTSFASVQLVLALEETFDVEFPEQMLNRRNLASIQTIKDSIIEVLGHQT